MPRLSANPTLEDLLDLLSPIGSGLGRMGGLLVSLESEVGRIKMPLDLSLLVSRHHHFAVGRSSNLVDAHVVHVLQSQSQLNELGSNRLLHQTTGSVSLAPHRTVASHMFGPPNLMRLGGSTDVEAMLTCRFTCVVEFIQFANIDVEQWTVLEECRTASSVFGVRVAHGLGDITAVSLEHFQHLSS